MNRIKQRLQRGFSWICAVGAIATLAFTGNAQTNPASLVIPSGFASTEATGGSGLIHVRNRDQTVYGSNHFPAYPIWIEGLKFRPNVFDGTPGVAFTTTISNLQINLSTTTRAPGGLSSIFSNNIGTDQTLVFSGPITVSSQFTGPAQGPKAFDVVIPLQQPFLYNPALGNLLVDVRDFSGEATCYVDAANSSSDSASRVVAQSATASSGFPDTGAAVILVTYSPADQIAPTILVQPESQSVEEGGSVAFHVVASGSGPLSYQWLFGGSEISGATSNSLTLSNVQSSDGGGYSVTVTNAFGSVTSSVAVLTVHPAGTNLDLVVPNGLENVEAAGGSGVIHVRNRDQTVYSSSHFPANPIWIEALAFRPNVYDGTPGHAFTTSISNLQINLSTTTKVPDGLSSVFSNNIGANETIVFSGPITLSSQFSGPAGGPKEFDILIPLQQPFLYDPTAGNLLLDIRDFSGEATCYIDAGNSGADAASRVVAQSATASSGFPDTGATVVLVSYSLADQIAPTIQVQPESRSVQEGGSVTFHVTAGGTAPLSYQWLFGGGEISGATSNSLTLSNVQLSDAGGYSVTVTNAFGSVTSSVAVLTVRPAGTNLDLVVPNGLENREAAGGSGPFHVRNRDQTVYSSSHFPANPIWIEALAFRPNIVDGTPGHAFTTSISNLQINMSTTTKAPDGLSPVFANNIGADETVVFSGPITLSSQFSGPAGGPKEFDILIPLQQPFLYDSTAGNLLLDIRDFSGEATCYIDAENSGSDAASRVVAQSATAPSGFPDTGATVVLVSYSAADQIAPTIRVQPENHTVREGGSVTFHVTAGGSAPLSYQWLFGGSEISGATSSSLTLSNVQLSDAGNYNVTVTNAFGSMTSSVAVLTVRPLGTNVDLVVPNGLENVEAAGGSGVIHVRNREQTVYRSTHFPANPIWIEALAFRPSVVDGTPGHAFTTSISNLQINMSTTTKAPDGLSSVFANNIGADETVVFSGPIALSSQFSGPAGGPKEFDILIPLQQPFLYDPTAGSLLLDIRDFSGEATCYIDAENSRSDAASRVVAQSATAPSGFPDTGATVVLVSYSAANEIAPVVRVQPESRTVREGGSATFHIVAGGTAPLSYQWFFGEVAINGATSSSLTLSNVQLSDAGGYSVTVTNAFGSVTSSVAVLTVRPLGTNLDLVVPNGLENVEAAGGSGVIHVRNRDQTVYRSSHFPANPIWIEALAFRPNVFDGTPGHAFTTSISNLQINLSTTTKAPDGLSSVFSNNIGVDEKVVFSGPITLSSQFSGPAGGPKEFDIVIPLQQQFLYDPSVGNLLLDIRDFSGEATCYIDAENSASDAASRVVAQSATAPSGFRDTGATVALISYSPAGQIAPTIRIQPESRTVREGSSVTFQVTAGGSAPLSYQWLFGGSEISGATSSSLTLSNVQLSDAGDYSVLVTNAFGSVTSSVAVLTVRPLGTNLDLVVPNGLENVEAAGGSGVIHVRNRDQTVYSSSHFPANPIWIEALAFRPNVFDGTPGHAFTTSISNLQINMSTTTKVPDGLSSVFSNNIGADETVVFSGPITLSSQFSGPAGGPKEFDIVIPLQQPFLYDPTAGNLLLDIRDFSGEATCYIDAGNSGSDAASRVVAQSATAPSGFRDTGATVALVSYSPANQIAPTIRVQPQSRTVREGGSVTFQVVASGSGPLSYQWLFGGSEITGATSSSLTLSNVQLSDAGDYSVAVTNAFGSVTSSVAVLTVRPAGTNLDLVVPNGLENVEAAGGSGPFHVRNRDQNVYSSSHFPANPIWIETLAFRPNVVDGTPGHAFTTSISNLQVNMSTTTKVPDGLSSVFSNNIGADETVVFSGPITLSSQFSGPAGGPKEFDIIIPLQQPFLYDPSAGNLLLDIRDFSGEATCYIDAENSGSDSASRVVASQSATAPSGFPDTGATVVLVSYSLADQIAPTIWVQPESQSVQEGGSVTLRVAASGSGSLSYQWFFGGGAIDGATSDSLTLSGVQSSDLGGYSVGVANEVESVMSSMAILTLSPTLRPDGTFTFSFTGDVGTTYRIETSTDLVYWETLTTVVNLTGSVKVVDPTAADSSHRFYRAVPVQ